MAYTVRPIPCSITPIHYYILHLYTSTSLHLYTITTLQPTPLHLYTLHLYTSTPLHLYIITPLHHYTTTPLHLTPLHLYTLHVFLASGVLASVELSTILPLMLYKINLITTYTFKSVSYIIQHLPKEIVLPRIYGNMVTYYAPSMYIYIIHNMVTII